MEKYKKINQEKAHQEKFPIGICYYSSEIKKYPLVTFSKELGSDIIFAEYSKNLKVDLAMAQEIVNNRLDFTQNKNHYFIIDFSNINYFNQEAKAYMQSPEGGAKNVLAAAFMASNMVATLLANVFIRKIKDVPSKFFSNKKDALKWIKGLKNER